MIMSAPEKPEPIEFDLPEGRGGFGIVDGAVVFQMVGEGDKVAIAFGMLELSALVNWLTSAEDYLCEQLLNEETQKLWDDDGDNNK
jgi:hypothetical protein